MPRTGRHSGFQNKTPISGTLVSPDNELSFNNLRVLSEDNRSLTVAAR